MFLEGDEDLTGGGPSSSLGAENRMIQNTDGSITPDPTPGIIPGII